MNRRRHEMPFGCELCSDGLARFRLWAPSATRVDLVIADARAPGELMERLDAGWYERIVPAPAALVMDFALTGT
jgi:1,4-alpha-glucan branching enzyme